MKNSLKKEKLQHKLFNSLLQSDFCLFQKKSAKQTSCINSIVKLNSSKWINSLDLLQISKSLKQLVRLFQFLKSQKKSLTPLQVIFKFKEHQNI